MPLNELDLSFHQYIATHEGAFWHGIPEQATSTLPAWQWAPALKLVMESDLETISELIGNGWERLTGNGGAEHWKSAQFDNARYLKLVSQLADVRLVEMPSEGDYELWARTEDIERAAARPVTLAFAQHGFSDEDFPRGVLSISERGLTMLHVAQVLPPPQFGEIALIDHTRDGVNVWEIYTLAALGDEGLALWQRMGRTLAALAAPGEWWPYTPQLAACLRGEYPQRRETLKARRAGAKGEERTRIYALMRQLALDMKHATALETARKRAQHDPAAWIEQWEEVRRMAAELAEMYWQAHQDKLLQQHSTVVVSDSMAATDTVEVEKFETADAIPISEEARIMADMVASNAATIDTPNYDEDQAFRMAVMAQPGAWTAEADTPKFPVSKNLAVYFMGTRDNPLSLAEAQAQLLDKRPHTVLTIRIALGLWNQRRNDPKLGRNGAALIPLNEILYWRGVPKHTKLAHPGTSSDQRFTDGWRTEDRESVRRDLELASRFYLRGKVNITYKGKTHEANIDDYYVNVGFFGLKTLWGGEEPAGAWVGPGSWINAHTDEQNYFLAEVDRRIFELSPHHEQHELKIALYLTERWREQANKGNYADAITMAELLRNSVIEIDKPNLTSRFAPRIEQAIETLRQRGIIGAYECLTPPDKTKRNWGKDWLAARWRILPPEAIRQSYIDKHITQPGRQLPPGRSSSGKKGGQKG